MADLERTTAAMPAHQQPTQTDIESLPGLFGRLGDDVVKLLDTKLSLVKVELKEETAAYVRSATIIAIGAVIALVGFVLANVGIACFVTTLFDNNQAAAIVEQYGPVSYGLGFVVTGAVYLVLGAILAYVGKSRLAARHPVPNRSVEELRKDKQWLKNEM